MPADAGIRFGQYVLIRRIARGGMAEVFLAQQRGLEGFDRRVAVKRILPHLADSQDFVKMFFGEAKLAAQLAHPNVVHIYEFGKVEHDYFIAMEFVDGVHAGQLFKYGEQKEKVPATLVARIGADAANALHYAHELRGGNGKLLGLVHRDVSPANIMVSFDGIVKLCDFGIAKAAAAGDQLTNPGQVKGKYAYMSPEQTIAAQLDGRSDVFSLGVVMWELLAGKYIVPRGDAVAAMRAIRDGKIEPIEKYAPDVPAPLAKALAWALEPKRDKRATAAEFAQALEAFLKSAPELATSMQLGGWIRARFAREGTGQVPALMGTPPGGAAAQHPGTQMSPGTFAAPRTAAASPNTMVAPGTVGGPGAGFPPAPLSSQLPAAQQISRLPSTPGPYPPRRVVKLLSDTGEGTEIYSTADLEDAEDTIKGARPTKPGAVRPSEPTYMARVHPSDEPTLHVPPPAFGDATDIVRNGPPDADEEDSDLGGETIQRDRRVPVPSGPTVVPTRVQAPLPAPNSEPIPRSSSHGAMRPGSEIVLGSDDSAARAVSESAARAAIPDPFARASGSGARGAVVGEPRWRNTPLPAELQRLRRKKMLIAIGSLAGLAFASFLIALAASSKRHGAAAAAPQDAAQITTARSDAALPIAPPPLDAAVSPTVPAVPADADTASVPVDDGMGYLIVRTIPDGGVVKVGDQSRLAVVQPGDPTGAASAQLVLPPGTHVVTAELAGYQAEKRTVVLDKGDHQRIEITFTKKLAGRPDHGPTGRLTVRTTPWSDVYLGAKKLGQAPFADLELPAGTHTLTFKNPSRPTLTKTVTIKPGKSTKLNFSLP